MKAGLDHNPEARVIANTNLIWNVLCDLILVNMVATRVDNSVVYEQRDPC